MPDLLELYKRIALRLKELGYPPDQAERILRFFEAIPSAEVSAGKLLSELGPHEWKARSPLGAYGPFQIMPQHFPGQRPTLDPAVYGRIAADLFHQAVQQEPRLRAFIESGDMGTEAVEAFMKRWWGPAYQKHPYYRDYRRLLIEGLQKAGIWPETQTMAEVLEELPAQQPAMAERATLERPELEIQLEVQPEEPVPQRLDARGVWEEVLKNFQAPPVYPEDQRRAEEVLRQEGTSVAKFLQNAIQQVAGQIGKRARGVFGGRGAPVPVSVKRRGDEFIITLPSFEKEGETLTFSIPAIAVANRYAALVDQAATPEAVGGWVERLLASSGKITNEVRDAVVARAWDAEVAKKLVGGILGEIGYRVKSAEPLGNTISVTFEDRRGRQGRISLGPETILAVRLQSAFPFAQNVRFLGNSAVIGNSDVGALLKIPQDMLRAFAEFFPEDERGLSGFLEKHVLPQPQGGRSPHAFAVNVRVNVGGREIEIPGLDIVVPPEGPKRGEGIRYMPFAWATIEEALARHGIAERDRARLTASILKRIEDIPLAVWEDYRSNLASNIVKTMASSTLGFFHVLAQLEGRGGAVEEALQKLWIPVTPQQPGVTGAQYIYLGPTKLFSRESAEFFLKDALNPLNWLIGAGVQKLAKKGVREVASRLMPRLARSMQVMGEDLAQVFLNRGVQMTASRMANSLRQTLAKLERKAVARAVSNYSRRAAEHIVDSVQPIVRRKEGEIVEVTEAALERALGQPERTVGEVVEDIARHITQTTGDESLAERLVEVVRTQLGDEGMAIPIADVASSQQARQAIARAIQSMLPTQEAAEILGEEFIERALGQLGRQQRTVAEVVTEVGRAVAESFPGVDEKKIVDSARSILGDELMGQPIPQDAEVLQRIRQGVLGAIRDALPQRVVDIPDDVISQFAEQFFLEEKEAGRILRNALHQGVRGEYRDWMKRVVHQLAPTIAEQFKTTLQDVVQAVDAIASGRPIENIEEIPRKLRWLGGVFSSHDDPLAKRTGEALSDLAAIVSQHGEAIAGGNFAPSPAWSALVRAIATGDEATRDRIVNALADRLLASSPLATKEQREALINGLKQSAETLRQITQRAMNLGLIGPPGTERFAHFLEAAFWFSPIAISAMQAAYEEPEKLHDIVPELAALTTATVAVPYGLSRLAGLAYRSWRTGRMVDDFFDDLLPTTVRAHGETNVSDWFKAISEQIRDAWRAEIQKLRTKEAQPPTPEVPPKPTPVGPEIPRVEVPPAPVEQPTPAPAGLEIPKVEVPPAPVEQPTPAPAGLEIPKVEVPPAPVEQPTPAPTGLEIPKVEVPLVSGFNIFDIVTRRPEKIKKVVEGLQNYIHRGGSLQPDVRQEVAEFLSAHVRAIPGKEFENIFGGSVSAEAPIAVIMGGMRAEALGEDKIKISLFGRDLATASRADIEKLMQKSRERLNPFLRRFRVISEEEVGKLTTDQLAQRLNAIFRAYGLIGETIAGEMRKLHNLLVADPDMREFFRGIFPDDLRKAQTTHGLWLLDKDRAPTVGEKITGRQFSNLDEMLVTLADLSSEEFSKKSKGLGYKFLDGILKLVPQDKQGGVLSIVADVLSSQLGDQPLIPGFRVTTGLGDEIVRVSVQSVDSLETPMSNIFLPLLKAKEALLIGIDEVLNRHQISPEIFTAEDFGWAVTPRFNVEQGEIRFGIGVRPRLGRDPLWQLAMLRRQHPLAAQEVANLMREFFSTVEAAQKQVMAKKLDEAVPISPTLDQHLQGIAALPGDDIERAIADLAQGVIESDNASNPNRGILPFSTNWAAMLWGAVRNSNDARMFMQNAADLAELAWAVQNGLETTPQLLQYGRNRLFLDPEGALKEVKARKERKKKPEDIHPSLPQLEGKLTTEAVALINRMQNYGPTFKVMKWLGDFAKRNAISLSPPVEIATKVLKDNHTTYIPALFALQGGFPGFISRIFEAIGGTVPAQRPGRYVLAKIARPFEDAVKWWLGQQPEDVRTIVSGEKPLGEVTTEFLKTPEDRLQKWMIPWAFGVSPMIFPAEDDEDESYRNWATILGGGMFLGLILSRSPLWRSFAKRLELITARGEGHGGPLVISPGSDVEGRARVMIRPEPEVKRAPRLFITTPTEEQIFIDPFLEARSEESMGAVYPRTGYQFEFFKEIAHRAFVEDILADDLGYMLQAIREGGYMRRWMTEKSLTKMPSDIQALIDRIEGVNEAYNAQIFEIENKINEINHQISDLKRQVEIKLDPRTVEEIQAQIQALEKEYADLEAQQQSLKEQLGRQDAIKKQLFKVQDRIDEVESRIFDLKGRLAVEQEDPRTVKEIQALEKEYADLKAQQQSLEEQLGRQDAIKKQLLEVRARIDEVNSQIFDLEERLAVKQGRQQEDPRTVEEIQAQIQALEKERADLNARRGKLEEQFSRKVVQALQKLAEEEKGAPTEVGVGGKLVDVTPPMVLFTRRLIRGELEPLKGKTGGEYRTAKDRWINALHDVRRMIEAYKEIEEAPPLPEIEGIAPPTPEEIETIITAKPFDEERAREIVRWAIHWTGLSDAIAQEATAGVRRFVDEILRAQKTELLERAASVLERAASVVEEQITDLDTLDETVNRGGAVGARTLFAQAGEQAGKQMNKVAEALSQLLGREIGARIVDAFLQGGMDLTSDQGFQDFVRAIFDVREDSTFGQLIEGIGKDAFGPEVTFKDAKGRLVDAVLESRSRTVIPTPLARSYAGIYEIGELGDLRLIRPLEEENRRWRTLAHFGVRQKLLDVLTIDPALGVVDESGNSMIRPLRIPREQIEKPEPFKKLVPEPSEEKPEPEIIILEEGEKPEPEVIVLEGEEKPEPEMIILEEAERGERAREAYVSVLPPRYVALALSLVGRPMTELYMDLVKNKIFSRAATKQDWIDGMWGVAVLAGWGNLRDRRVLKGILQQAFPLKKSLRKAAKEAGEKLGIDFTNPSLGGASNDVVNRIEELVDLANQLEAESTKRWTVFLKGRGFEDISDWMELLSAVGRASWDKRSTEEIITDAQHVLNTMAEAVEGGVQNVPSLEVIAAGLANWPTGWRSASIHLGENFGPAKKTDLKDILSLASAEHPKFLGFSLLLQSLFNQKIADAVGTATYLKAFYDVNPFITDVRGVPADIRRHAAEIEQRAIRDLSPAKPELARALLPPLIFEEREGVPLLAVQYDYLVEVIKSAFLRDLKAEGVSTGWVAQLLQVPVPSDQLFRVLGRYMGELIQLTGRPAWEALEAFQRAAREAIQGAASGGAAAGEQEQAAFLKLATEKFSEGLEEAVSTPITPLGMILRAPSVMEYGSIEKGRVVPERLLTVGRAFVQEVATGGLSPHDAARIVARFRQQVDHETFLRFFDTFEREWKIKAEQMRQEENQGALKRLRTFGRELEDIESIAVHGEPSEIERSWIKDFMEATRPLEAPTPPSRAVDILKLIQTAENIPASDRAVLEKIVGEGSGVFSWLSSSPEVQAAELHQVLERWPDIVKQIARHGPLKYFLNPEFVGVMEWDAYRSMRGVREEYLIDRLSDHIAAHIRAHEDALRTRAGIDPTIPRDQLTLDERQRLVGVGVIDYITGDLQSRVMQQGRRLGYSLQLTAPLVGGRAPQVMDHLFGIGVPIAGLAALESGDDEEQRAWERVMWLVPLAGLTAQGIKRRITRWVERGWTAPAALFQSLTPMNLLAANLQSYFEALLAIPHSQVIQRFLKGMPTTGALRRAIAGPSAGERALHWQLGRVLSSFWAGGRESGTLFDESVRDGLDGVARYLGYRDFRSLYREMRRAEEAILNHQPIPDDIGSSAAMLGIVRVQHAMWIANRIMRLIGRQVGKNAVESLEAARHALNELLGDEETLMGVIRWASGLVKSPKYLEEALAAEVQREGQKIPKTIASQLVVDIIRRGFIIPTEPSGAIDITRAILEQARDFIDLWHDIAREWGNRRGRVKDHQTAERELAEVFATPYTVEGQRVLGVGGAVVEWMKRTAARLLEVSDRSPLISGAENPTGRTGIWPILHVIPDVVYFGIAEGGVTVPLYGAPAWVSEEMGMLKARQAAELLMRSSPRPKFYEPIIRDPKAHIFSVGGGVIQPEIKLTMSDGSQLAITVLDVKKTSEQPVVTGEVTILPTFLASGESVERSVGINSLKVGDKEFPIGHPITMRLEDDLVVELTGAGGKPVEFRLPGYIFEVIERGQRWNEWLASLGQAMYSDPSLIPLGNSQLSSSLLFTVGDGLYRLLGQAEPSQLQKAWVEFLGLLTSGSPIHRGGILGPLDSVDMYLRAGMGRAVDAALRTVSILRNLFIAMVMNVYGSTIGNAAQALHLSHFLSREGVALAESIGKDPGRLALELQARVFSGIVPLQAALMDMLWRDPVVEKGVFRVGETARLHPLGMMATLAQAVLRRVARGRSVEIPGTGGAIRVVRRGDGLRVLVRIGGEEVDAERVLNQLVPGWKSEAIGIIRASLMGVESEQPSSLARLESIRTFTEEVINRWTLSAFKMQEVINRALVPLLSYGSLVGAGVPQERALAIAGRAQAAVNTHASPFVRPGIVALPRVFERAPLLGALLSQFWLLSGTAFSMGTEFVRTSAIHIHRALREVMRGRPEDGAKVALAYLASVVTMAGLLGIAGVPLLPIGELVWQLYRTMKGGRDEDGRELPWSAIEAITERKDDPIVRFLTRGLMGTAYRVWGDVDVMSRFGFTDNLTMKIRQLLAPQIAYSERLVGTLPLLSPVVSVAQLAGALSGGDRDEVLRELSRAFPSNVRYRLITEALREIEDVYAKGERTWADYVVGILRGMVDGNPRITRALVAALFGLGDLDVRYAREVLGRVREARRMTYEEAQALQGFSNEFVRMLIEGEDNPLVHDQMIKEVMRVSGIKAFEGEDAERVALSAGVISQSLANALMRDLRDFPEVRALLETLRRVPRISRARVEALLKRYSSEGAGLEELAGDLLGIVTTLEPEDFAKLTPDREGRWVEALGRAHAVLYAMLIKGKADELTTKTVGQFERPTVFPWGNGRARASFEGAEYPSALISLILAAQRLGGRVFRITVPGEGVMGEEALEFDLDDLQRALVRISTSGGRQVDPREIPLDVTQSARVVELLRRMLRAYERNLPDIVQRAVGTVLVGVDRAMNDPDRLLELFGEPEPPDTYREVNELWREVQLPVITERLLRESGWDKLTDEDRRLLMRVIRSARERRPMVGVTGLRVRTEVQEEPELLLFK